MNPKILCSGLLLVIASSIAADAQIEDICGEFGITPSLDPPFAHVPYVYGRVTAKGVDSSAKIPKLTVKLVTIRSSETLTLGRSGNYCFKRNSGGGEIVVEINRLEAGRRSLPSFGESQQREDFEIEYSDPDANNPPSIVSAKFAHPRNEKTAELYKKTLGAETKGDTDMAIESLKAIVVIDPADFIAWAKLGSLYLDRKSYADADSALRRSLELRVDYTPGWIQVGKLRAAQKEFEAAIEILKHAISLEPESARIHQLLGETYLQARQGTLGERALREALRLEPIGMAECHLLLAHLYDLAGAPKLAADEYRSFLQKVPQYRDKKKLEKYIKENQNARPN